MGKNGVRAQRTRNIPKHLFAALNFFVLHSDITRILTSSSCHKTHGIVSFTTRDLFQCTQFRSDVFSEGHFSEVHFF